MLALVVDMRLRGTNNGIVETAEVDAEGQD